MYIISYTNEKKQASRESAKSNMLYNQWQFISHKQVLSSKVRLYKHSIVAEINPRYNLFSYNKYITIIIVYYSI